MNRIDIPTMAAQLNLLAEVYEKRHVTEKAALVWFDTLKEFPTERVCGILIGWPKTHGKFPVPAEVWKSCNDFSIGDREARAAREKAAVFEPTADPAHVRKMLHAMREILKRPKLSPREHWQKMLATKPAGSIGHTFATQALKPKTVHREPGEDDELAA